MSAQPLSFIDPADYLADEHARASKHEYVDGQVHLQAGASRPHNLVTGNLFAALHPMAREHGCEAMQSDMKVRIDAANCFYYPDVLVRCTAADDPDPHYLRNPCFIAEVMSPSTRGIDRREKWRAYQTLSCLRTYALLEQDAVSATVYQRDGVRWSVETLAAGDAMHIACLNANVNIDTIYAGVPLAPPSEYD